MRKLRQRAAKGKTRFRAWPYVVAGAIFVTIGSGVGVFNMLTRDGEEPEETKVRGAAGKGARRVQASIRCR